MVGFSIEFGQHQSWVNHFLKKPNP